MTLFFGSAQTELTAKDCFSAFARVRLWAEKLLSRREGLYLDSCSRCNGAGSYQLTDRVHRRLGPQPCHVCRGRGSLIRQVGFP